jgi:hypothetical protein
MTRESDAADSARLLGFISDPFLGHKQSEEEMKIQKDH